jgi:hypothetical protein
MQRPITFPSRTLSAAKSVVVPLRLATPQHDVTGVTTPEEMKRGPLRTWLHSAVVKWFRLQLIACSVPLDKFCLLIAFSFWLRERCQPS